MNRRLQVREPLGPLVSARSVPLPELEHYPGGRWGPYVTGAVGVGLGLYGTDVMLAAGLSLPAYWLLAPILAVLWLPPYVVPWARRLRMRRPPLWDGAGEAPHGTVRLAGVIRALDDTFPVPGAARPVVYARTRYAQAGSDGERTTRGREDIRGVRFRIELAGGASVQVEPQDVWLLEGDVFVPEVGTSVRWALGAAWARDSRATLQRSSLAPGDKVEAVGELARAVDVDGQAAPGRGVPMAYRLRRAWPRGIWIRRTG